MTVVCIAVSDDLIIGDSYYFGVAFDSRVHHGVLLQINLADILETSAEFCDLDAGGRYVTVPISLVSEDRKIAQVRWKKIFSKSKRGKYSIQDVMAQ